MITFVLYFTIFTGIESIPPGTSDLGVTIQIGFGYAMQHEGEESNEVSFPDVHENMLRSDAVPSLLGERSELLIALFPMMRANTCSRRFPAYVEEAQSGFTRGRIEARHPSKTKGDRFKRNYLFKSTVQLTM